MVVQGNSRDRLTGPQVDVVLACLLPQEALWQGQGGGLVAGEGELRRITATSTEGEELSQVPRAFAQVHADKKEDYLVVGCVLPTGRKQPGFASAVPGTYAHILKLLGSNVA